jgi:serine/threonine-protein kinase
MTGKRARTWIPGIPALAIAAALWPSTARANDPATATMLFNEGKRLMGEGNFAEACPKFEESQRLDPGVGTQFNLADCYERAGRTATAWATFMDVASELHATGDAKREKVARDRGATLEPKLSKLTILTPKNATGLEVRRNGEVLGGAVWNNAVPVDPGSYTIEATAPGKKKWSSVAAVGPNGAVVTVTIPDLVTPDASETAPATPPSTQATQTLATQTPVPTTPEETPSAQPGQTQRTLALVAAGVGVVGIGVGTGFGLTAFSKHSAYLTHCVGSVCDATGVQEHDDAASSATISTIAISAGLVLAAGGAVLWFTAPKAVSKTAIRVVPAVGPSSGGMTISGLW